MGRDETGSLYFMNSEDEYEKFADTIEEVDLVANGMDEDDEYIIGADLGKGDFTASFSIEKIPKYAMRKVTGQPKKTLKELMSLEEGSKYHK